MKKVLLALAVIATVACMSSCTKKCTCKLITGAEAEYELDDLKTTYAYAGITIEKCSDVNIEGVVECK